MADEWEKALDAKQILTHRQTNYDDSGRGLKILERSERRPYNKMNGSVSYLFA